MEEWWLTWAGGNLANLVVWMNLWVKSGLKPYASYHKPNLSCLLYVPCQRKFNIVEGDPMRCASHSMCHAHKFAQLFSKLASFAQHGLHFAQSFFFKCQWAFLIVKIIYIQELKFFSFTKPTLIMFAMWLTFQLCFWVVYFICAFDELNDLIFCLPCKGWSYWSLIRWPGLPLKWLHMEKLKLHQIYT